MKALRSRLHHYIPANFSDPLGLFLRIIRSKNPDALFTLASSLLGISAIPLDLIFKTFEQRLYQQASTPRLPIIFIAGPPRSGTTLVSQVLITHLPVAYLNNLTALFPRSPIMANKLFPKAMDKSKISTNSFYGKTSFFSGNNDALYIWDRWLDKDRTKIITTLNKEKQKEMNQFFGAYQALFNLPIINKNNNLNIFAHLIAEAIDNAYFIFLKREPLYLAQSLILSRKTIHGTPNVKYGITDENHSPTDNYIEDVCRQVVFHEQSMEKQQKIIGPERLWFVQYEDFCQNPLKLIKDVSTKILKQSIDKNTLSSVTPFKISKEIKLPHHEFETLQKTLKQFGLTMVK